MVGLLRARGPCRSALALRASPLITPRHRSRHRIELTILQLRTRSSRASARRSQEFVDAKIGAWREALGHQRTTPTLDATRHER